MNSVHHDQLILLVKGPGSGSSACRYSLSFKRSIGLSMVSIRQAYNVMLLIKRIETHRLIQCYDTVEYNVHLSSHVI